MLKTKEQLDPCTVELNIEVEAERVGEAIDKAYKDLSKSASIPGFRKGKAPRQILERYIDEEDVRERAANRLILPAYEDAIKEAEIEPFDIPTVEIIQLEEKQPFIFKAKVPLPPKVELGDYTGLTVERMAPVVSEEDVDTRIQEVLERGATLVAVTDRPVQTGDAVSVEMQRLDPEAEDIEPFSQMIQAGSNNPVFDEQLIGMNSGEERVIEISHPEDSDDKEFAGKTIQIKTKVLEIKERRIPELDDEFAKAVGVESAEELCKTLRENMEQAATNVADRQVESQLIFQAVENADIHFPESMKEHESEHRLQDLLERLSEAKLELTAYLREMDKSFEELKAEIDANSERDIKVNLVLLEIARKENIEVTRDDVDAEIERMAEEKNVPKASMQAYLERTDGMETIPSRLIRRKVLDFLTQASNIKSVDMKGASK